MVRILCLSFLAFAVACSQVKQAQMQKPLSNAIPALHVTTDTGNVDLKISALAIDVRVIGNVAITTFDIRFYNGLDRVLEGEFDFPLADGQTVSRYALETAGKLREGVVVEKAKARVAYEATVRKGIDPGLVEKTRGNNFRTRLYPIPAKGYKRVVIGIEQKLSVANAALSYQLPLQAKEAIDDFSIEATVLHAQTPKKEGDSFLPFSFRRSEIGYEGDWHKAGFTADHLFAFSVPVDEDAETVYTESRNGKTYFYAAGWLEPTPEEEAKPSVVGLLWDVSASSTGRDKGKETALLKAYLTKLQNIRLLLIPFHVAPLPAQEFNITNGDASALIKKLGDCAYDGGTQLGALHLSEYAADAFLLFSDGLSTFGKKEMGLPDKPVTTLASSPSADYAYLKFIAGQTKGVFLDLTKLDATKAAEAALRPSLQFTGSSVAQGSIESLVTELSEADHSFSVSGILAGNEATVDLRFGYGTEPAVTKKIHVEKSENKAEGVARLWASMQIDELDLQYQKNKEQITALGKKFSVVTQATSLLVLDRVEDYVQYEILPPPELQKEYFALLKESQTEKSDAKKAAMDEAVQAMDDLKVWWTASYTGRKKKRQANDIQYERMEIGLATMQATTDSGRVLHYSQGEAQTNRQVPSPPPPPRTPPPIETSKFIENIKPTEKAVEPPPMQEKLEDVQVSEKNQEADKVAGPPPPPPVDEGKGVVTATEQSESETAGRPSSEISTAGWKPDAAYLKTLDKASTQNAFTVYLDLKKDYASQPSFYFDVARWFFDKGQKETAVLVLSNVAELKLESPELLRMMGYQLLDFDEKGLAIETFRDVLALREEEPQAYRDLALALNDAGNYAEAVDLLYKVITRVWDGRFTGVKSIALNEMNSILSAHKAAVNTSAIDGRLIYAMPVDVRITLDWNTDNSDVDLWVTDPKKEKCFYQHKETSTGGRLSDDMTQGYGPEEFAVKKAAGGEYVIEANLFGDSRQTIGGPITIRADLYTDFGKPTQSHKRINLRVTEAKEVVKLGSLKFG